MEYPDDALFRSTVRQIERLPPLISQGEVLSLRRQLAEVAAGKRFLLQGGDCAERFCRLLCGCDRAETEDHAANVSCVDMGCAHAHGACGGMAVSCKAAKFPYEVIGGVTYNSFRGDNVNGFDLANRTPDPNRLLQGYFHSASTLNYARALIKDGFADVRAAKHWNLGFVKSSENRAKYEKMVKSIREASEFVQVCGLTDLDRLKSVDLFICHEALHLDYEEAMTRKVSTVSDKRVDRPIASSSTPGSGSGPDSFMNLGAHFIWIGDVLVNLTTTHRVHAWG